MDIQSEDNYNNDFKIDFTNGANAKHFDITDNRDEKSSMQPHHLCNPDMEMNANLHQLPQHEVYSCGVCGIRFKSPWVLKDHMQLHSGDSVQLYPCEVCGIQLRSSWMLNDHMTIHCANSTQFYPCEFCPVQFKDLQQLEMHRLVHSKYLPNDHTFSNISSQPYACTNEHNRDQHQTFQEQCNKKIDCKEMEVKKTDTVEIVQMTMITKDGADSVNLKTGLSEDTTGIAGKEQKRSESQKIIFGHDYSSDYNIESNRTKIKEQHSSTKQVETPYNLTFPTSTISDETETTVSKVTDSLDNNAIELRTKNTKAKKRKKNYHIDAETSLVEKPNVGPIQGDSAEIKEDIENTNAYNDNVANETRSTNGINVVKDEGNVIYEESNKDSQVPGLYSCGICGKQYRQPSVLRTHMLVHSGERPFECEKCPSKFKSRWLLKQHNVVHSEETPFACEQCPSRFKSLASLKQHLEKHLDERQFGCEICESKFKSLRSLKQHVKLMHSAVNPSFPCDLCGRSFKSKWQLKQHVFIHSSTNPYPCGICNAEFKWASQLATHIRIHAEGDTYICEICTKTHETARDLQQHMLIHTGTTTTDFACQLCDLRFTEVACLKTHMLEHTGKRNFACDKCSKTFYNIHHLKRHELTHEEIKPHACCFCDRTFVTKAQLDRHVLTHTGEKNFECDLCLKRFMTAADLSEHRKLHTGEKALPCHVCSKMFARPGNLTAHLKTHAGIRPYKCEICDKRFTAKSTLTAHARVHTGETPYSCLVCSKKFRMYPSLAQHMIGHSGVKPHGCVSCEKRFTTSSHLKQHMRSHERKERLLKRKLEGAENIVSDVQEVKSVSENDKMHARQTSQTRTQLDSFRASRETNYLDSDNVIESIKIEPELLPMEMPFSEIQVTEND